MCGWGHFTRGMRDAYTFQNNTPTDTLRAWGDFVVASHAAFVPALLVALAHGVYDVLVLMIPMLVLSVCYHRTREKNAAVARVELCWNAVVFLYGLMQARVCPHWLLQAFELTCAGLVLATYFACFYLMHMPAVYDFWHPIGMHVVPAVWILAVTLEHECLLCGGTP